MQITQLVDQKLTSVGPRESLKVTSVPLRVLKVSSVTDESSSVWLLHETITADSSSAASTRWRLTGPGARGANVSCGRTRLRRWCITLNFGIVDRDNDTYS